MFSTKECVKVTASEMEALKTNEILRRRKIRLQQVREQSKEIARKIRQRAKIEKSKHVIELDSKKEKEYLERQEKLVSELEDLYAKRLKAFGAGHQSANDVVNSGTEEVTVDLSKIRGKEAAAKLLKEKQQRLDAEKKKLDRKLQAREAANEISREKSKCTMNLAASSKSNKNDEKSKQKIICDEKDHENNGIALKDTTTKKNDMGTQWESVEMPNDLEQDEVPQLKLTDDDKTVTQNSAENVNTDKSKRRNMFALSDEMPSSLRGGLSNISQDSTKVLPSSLTLVSEYLKQRNLRLRESDLPITNKQLDKADLQSIKETLFKTRTSVREGKASDVSDVHVHDDQVIPVPAWKPEKVKKRPYVAKAPIFTDICDNVYEPQEMFPTSELRCPSSYRRTKVLPYQSSSPGRGSTYTDGTNSGVLSSAAPKTKPVTVYNHSTRDTKSLPKQNVELVAREEPTEDAYSQAVRESNTRLSPDKEQLIKLQNARNKVAMTKQNIEKEYQETMSFLNSLPKEMNNQALRKPPVRQAFMDESRQQTLRQNRQRKMQHEFKEAAKATVSSFQSEPADITDMERSELKYSWMPVPDGDESLAVHTIAASPRSGRAARPHGVRFDTHSYHEYRTRHKHTPPTRDRRPSSPSPSDNSESSPTTQLDTSDSERIIIYKIIDKHSKKECRAKKASERAEKSPSRVKKSPERNVGEEKPTEEDSKGDKVVNEQGDGVPSTHCPEQSAAEKLGNSCRCTCNVSSTEDQVKDAVPVMQWDCGDGRPLIRNTNRPTCKCVKSVAPDISATGPSASSSSTSFQTAGAAITNQPPATQETRHVKVVDETGEKSGDFYIGASGFLKDNAYEVVIQLRKKENTDSQIPHQSAHSSNDLAKESATITSTESNLEAHSASKNVPTDNVANANEHRLDRSKEKNEETVTVPVDSKEFSEPKTKYVSTCTQTASTTPTQIPVLFQLSSSTSTTYMSPPDLILPDALKDEEKYNRMHGKEYSKEKNRGKCKCKKCKRNKNFSAERPSDTDTDKDPRKIRTKQKIHSEKEIRSKCCKCRKCFAVSEKAKKDTVTLRKPQKITRPSKNANTGKIDPTIRRYIEKLLTLNNHGMRAIEVVNQECSSVTTPGSSVININSNVDIKKPSAERKLSIKKIHEALKHISDGSKISFDNNDTTKSFKVPRSKLVHKIKSLNVSKKLHVHKKPRRSVLKCSSPSSKDVLQKVENKTRSKSSPEKNRPHSRNNSNETERSHDHRKHDTLVTVNIAENSQGNRGPRKHSVTNSESSSSTRTNKTTSSHNTDVETDTNFIKLPTSKHQIRDNTAIQAEKCTQRVSELTKILEEVRKNKSLAYSQMSNTDPSVHNQQQNSDKSVSDIKTDSDDNFDKLSDYHKVPFRTSPDVSPIPCDNNESAKDVASVPSHESCSENKCTSPNIKTSSDDENSDDIIVKLRRRPPPAISRINFKQSEDHITPHELSTVLEVDSPMSTILKTPIKVQSQRDNIRNVNAGQFPESGTIKQTTGELQKQNTSTSTSHKEEQRNKSKTDEMPKSKMLDLKKFNDIMLKPFIAIDEFAKQCNVSRLDDASQIDDLLRYSAVANDEMSSLHSEGSLPDVNAELIKRKLISKPFKFDSLTINSTNDSSESSIFFNIDKLNKSKPQNRKASFIVHDKENIAESSDTLSMSSNPDLENAFKKLGIGWASSTLKKTKERLALSSSTNTSCSSSQNAKSRYTEKQSDAQLASLIMKTLKTPNLKMTVSNDTRAADKHNSRSKSMTVKEFLTNELSKKITFGDEAEFISLCETKMPEEMKQTTQLFEGEQSVDGTLSNANRARTSTPVQIFKSTTYNSSSSSNNNGSNGLFSNADDLSSVKVTSSSMRNNSTTDKDDLTIPNYSLRKKKDISDFSKSE